MRVVHVIKMVGIAGAERHLLMLLSGLRARDVDAQIVLLVEPSNPMTEFVRAAEARDIPIRSVVIHGDFDVTLVRRLRAVFRELSPDIVHTHLLHADVFGIPAARSVGVPVVVTSRHNDNAFRRAVPIRLTNQALWRMVNAGIAISGALARFCVVVEGAPQEKIHTIYYGLEYQADANAHRLARENFRRELDIGQDASLVGVVCRLVEQKGVTYGLQAFARVAPRYPDAHLIIAGDGTLRAALEAEARALGCTDRIHFLGWRADVTPVLAALDILLMPSLWEGFGLVMLEAMAQRVPIIGSDVSAIPEVVARGETGLLVPPRDVDALEGALDTLLGDEALRRHMGLLGEDRLETLFSAARMVEQTLALYNHLLTSRKR